MINSSTYMAVVAVATVMLLKPVVGQAVDYPPVKLAWMILYADAIALVERLDRRAASYRVAPVLQLKGEVLPGNTVITESSRWNNGVFKNYSKRVLVFLQHDRNSNQWQLMGASGEGYAPVDNGFVYLPGVAVGHEKLLSHVVGGEKITSLRLRMDTLTEVIQDVRDCYPSSYRSLRNRASLCSSRELESLATKSELHTAVFKDVAQISEAPN